MTSAIVVDDDRDTLQAFCNLLDAVKIDVVGKGKKGKEALSLYKSLKPDVVFMDIMMPEYDGFYGLKTIKEFDKDAIVLIVTGSVSEDTEIRSKEHNPSAIVYKPFDVSELLKTVEDLLSKRQAKMVTN